MYSYRHHVIPRHEWKRRFGNLKGFDASDNVVWLSLEQHTEVHRLLFELNGSRFDELAYRMLSGQVGKEEGTRIAISLGTSRIHTEKENFAKSQRMKLVAQTEKFKEEKRILMIGNKYAFGNHYVRPKDANKATSIGLMGNRNALGFKYPKEYGQEISKRLKGVSQPVVSCSHCETVGGATLMKRYHFDNCKKRSPFR